MTGQVSCARLEAGCRVHLVAGRFDRGRFPANRWGAGIRSLCPPSPRFRCRMKNRKPSWPASESTATSRRPSRGPRAGHSVETNWRQGQSQLNRLSTWIGERTLLIVGVPGLGNGRRCKAALGVVRPGASSSLPTKSAVQPLRSGPPPRDFENLPAPGGESAPF